MPRILQRIATSICGLVLAAHGASPPPDDCCPGSQDGAGGATTAPSPPSSLSGQVNRSIPSEEPLPVGLPGNPTPHDFFRFRLFEEPLVPIGGPPSAEENAALAEALRAFAARAIGDDFSALESFLEAHPASPWRAAVLTNLGLEAYRTGRYSSTLTAWAEAWQLGKDCADAPGRALADRAAGELASMYARLGRMEEISALLSSVEGRVFSGSATERFTEAREGLWTMEHDPGVAFRCGPLALLRIQIAVDPEHCRTDLVHASQSTKEGFSLNQVAELAGAMGMNYRAAFRTPGAKLMVPAVIHWKVGHYAAIVRESDGCFLVQDPTFRNDVWVTRETLDAEASGYFLIPGGDLPEGWRPVDTAEGAKVWGKGNVGGPEPGGGGGGPRRPKPCKGMAVPDVDLLFISLALDDEPLGYTPPVGPEVHFQVSYNQREAAQPANFSYSNLGTKWTFDWLAYIQDNPTNLNADVQYYRRGGFIRGFTGFDATTQSFTLQPLDLTKLVRTGAASYEMIANDGSKMVFSQSDGSVGTSRKVFLKQVIDPDGNALTLSYDASLRVTAIADAIGQVTTLSYQHPTDIYKITKVTDPFGRFATFQYDGSNRLSSITDVIGLISQFTYEGSSDFINTLVTPYGTTTFTKAEAGTTRSLETLYPDGQRERVEFNQTTTLGIPNSDPAASVPAGMSTRNEFLWWRNTYYWDKLAYAASAGDYTKAEIFHWLHTANPTTAARILESEKRPLEGRIWYDYPGQTAGSIFAGTHNQPSHVGRVLDDGSTQLSTYEYNSFGNLTRETDPVGRSFSYVYAANGQDLLEVRMTRNGANELLAKFTYNNRHLPLTHTDAAGQTTTYTYNTRGQLLTEINANGEMTSYQYDANGHLTSRNGPLPGPGDTTTWTYDVVSRVHTMTNESGYTLTFDYDALDRLTKVTYPDGTDDEFVFNRLDRTLVRDRANRETTLEYNSVQELTKRTDPLNRVTRYQWCKCGDLKSLIDPMGRTTTWRHDLQGRVTAKQYPDGSGSSYTYENTSGRLQQVIDEKNQLIQYRYGADDNLLGVTYSNASIATPNVTFTHDPDYNRPTSMTDGSGTTLYGYHPIISAPSPGAGMLASIDGPLPNDTITLAYDELGRQVSRSINGVAASMSFDAALRLTNVTHALGAFAHTYDGSSKRRIGVTYPNGQTTEYAYGSNAQDRHLQRVTHKLGVAAISEFLQGVDVPKDRTTTWSQQAGIQTPALHTLSYDTADQVTADVVTVGGGPAGNFAYTYDPAGNRLTEQIGVATRQASYNALNELTAAQPGAATPASYEWDAEQRLSAVVAGNQRTEFSYDGLGRRVGIRHLVNAAEVSNRRFVWCGDRICEERTPAGVVTKRYFEEGMKVETGPTAGIYFYTRDHLGSIRELTDIGGAVRARYSYDPFGRSTRIAGDLEADFGFAGMFRSLETGLNLTWYRAYDPDLGRWLSRDPMPLAELADGPNLYVYVRNRPIDVTDALGLSSCCEPYLINAQRDQGTYQALCTNNGPHQLSASVCQYLRDSAKDYMKGYYECAGWPCFDKDWDPWNPKPPPGPKPGGGAGPGGGGGGPGGAGPPGGPKKPDGGCGKKPTGGKPGGKKNGGGGAGGGKPCKKPCK